MESNQNPYNPTKSALHFRYRILFTLQKDGERQKEHLVHLKRKCANNDDKHGVPQAPVACARIPRRRSAPHASGLTTGGALAAGGSAVLMGWAGAAIPVSQASARALARAIPAVARAGAGAGGVPRHAGTPPPPTPPRARRGPGGAGQGAGRGAGAAAAGAVAWAWASSHPPGRTILR